MRCTISCSASSLAHAPLTAIMSARGYSRVRYLTRRINRIPLLRTACTISRRAKAGNASGTYTPASSCGMHFTNRAVIWAVPQAIGDDGILRRRNSDNEGNSASQRMTHDRPCLSPYTKTARANRSLCRIPCCTNVVIARGVGVAGNRTGLSPRDRRNFPW